MMGLRTYNVTVSPTGDFYEVLLRSAAPFSDRVGLIVRSRLVRLEARASAVLDELAPLLIICDDVESWPGTLLVGGRKSTRYLYELNSASLDVLIGTSSDLFEWINPVLPEDLHFLRSDGSTVLGSIAQERDVWLELSDEEYEHFQASLPRDLGGSFRRVDS